MTAGHGAFPDASFGKLTIAHDNIYAVIALVHLTGECHTDRDRQTVAERTGVHLDTIDFIVGVTDVLGEILGNRFQILAGEESFLAENRVKCLNRMTFTEDKAVMIGIMKILGSNIHLLVIQDVERIDYAHVTADMSALCVVDDIEDILTQFVRVCFQVHKSVSFSDQESEEILFSPGSPSFIRREDML